MKIKKNYSILIFILFFTWSIAAQNQVVETLRCEHLTNPLGIDTPNPRFTWRINDQTPNTKQEAYEILVGETPHWQDNPNEIIWRSGKVYSRNALAVYTGEKLKPRTRYYWSVTIWDNQGNKTTNSHPVFFETAKMDEPWLADWISDSQDTLIEPASFFRKDIILKNDVKKARVYLTAAGLFELHINGKKIDDDYFNPMFTRYDKRNLYLVHDVTKDILKGDNAIGVILGNGWYNHQSWSEWDFHKAVWRNRPSFCMELHIEYTDGTVETVLSNDEWKTSLGPIVFNSIYTGEHYDARKELTGWNMIEFNDDEWKDVKLRKAPSNVITAQAMNSIRIIDRFNNLECVKINDSTYLYKLPENIAGISKFRYKGERGTVFRLKHGETIDNENHVDQSTIDIYSDHKDGKDPFQTDIFILKGEGIEEFAPRFNYKGFQYIEVIADRPVSLNTNNITAYRINSDVRAIGRIESSDELINKIWEATNRSYLSNLYGYPTDCPQREKNGWTGDAHIAIDAALFNFDAITVYEKWLGDHRDSQLENGILPAIIPTSSWGYTWGNGVDWTSSMIIIPWKLYLYYGDTRPLSQNYPNMKQFLEYVTSISPNGLTEWGLGDWVPYKTIANKELLVSLYYYHCADVLSKTAIILGYEEDNEKYSNLAQKIKNAINDKYLDKESGMYASGSQAELSGPLYWGIVPNEYKQKVADHLAKRVVKDNKHLDVGVLGSKTLLGALSNNGYVDLAFEIATQKTYPSWGWWIQNGATTLFETWKIETETLSRNHVMFGEISAWFYKTLGGINVDERNPGFNSVIIRPYFVKKLENFKAEYDSTNGMIISSWKCINDVIEFELTIPVNCEATLFLDNVISGIENLTRKENGSFSLESGNYKFIVSIDLASASKQ